MSPIDIFYQLCSGRCTSVGKEPFYQNEFKPKFYLNRINISVFSGDHAPMKVVVEYLFEVYFLKAYCLKVI